MARRAPTEEDRREAVRRLLAGLAAGSDALQLAAAVADLHPKNDTFPGDAFMAVAADALEVAQATMDHPIDYQGLRETYLSECEFRGRENRKIQFAILATASRRGGLRPDLLDEIYWWQTDDFWRYGLRAAVALIRASADRQGLATADFARHLAERAGVSLA